MNIYQYLALYLGDSHETTIGPNNSLKEVLDRIDNSISHAPQSRRDTEHESWSIYEICRITNFDDLMKENKELSKQSESSITESTSER